MPLVPRRPYFVYLRIPRPKSRTPRRRTLGLRRVVAGDVVLLLVVVAASSIVDSVFGVLSFFFHS